MFTVASATTDSTATPTTTEPSTITQIATDTTGYPIDITSTQMKTSDTETSDTVTIGLTSSHSESLPVNNTKAGQFVKQCLDKN